MKIGDKVIYTHREGFDIGRPFIGYITATNAVFWGICETPEHSEDCEYIYHDHVHPYTSTRWTAWLRWLVRTAAGRRQHAQLMRGEIPADLVQEATR